MDLFRADFSGGAPEKSPWNICLAEIFADNYMKRGLPFSQLKDVSNYFLTYLRSLQTVRQRMATPATSKSRKPTAHEEDSRRNRIRKRKKTVSLLHPLLHNYTDTFDQFTSGSKAN